MFTVSVPDFLRMAEAKPHQVLKQEGILQQYNQTMGPALFVSHQWCGRDHPDPNFAQLAILQGFLRKVFRGEAQVQADLFSIAIFKLKLSIKAKQLMELRGGYVWYDYFSVPQPGVYVAEHMTPEDDFGKAVMSIPAYVEMSKYFIILAPPVAHADFKGRIVDYTTWKQRGWCRLERVARTMSPKETTLLLVVRDSLAYHVGAQDYILDSVGDGMFTVEADKAMLAPIVQSLVRNKLHALLRQQDLHRYRRLLAVRTSLLRGLPLSAEECCAPGFPAPTERQHGPRSELDDFLHLYGFSSATERSRGSEPILFAAMAGDLPVIRGLLERRACISTCERKEEPEFMMTKGHNVLHHAGQFARIAALVRPLVELRANLLAKDVGPGAIPLHWAAAGGCADTVDAMIDVGADFKATDAFGVTPLDTAVHFGRHEVVFRLLARGFPVDPNADSMSPLTFATVFPAGAGVVNALLAARADPNIRAAPRFGSPLSVMLFALSLPHRLRGSRLPLPLLGYHGHGATPLAIAAVMGHVAEARALVAGGADTLSRNARGKTPAQLAELAGLSPNIVAFFRGPVAEDLPEEVANNIAVQEGDAFSLATSMYRVFV